MDKEASQLERDHIHRVCEKIAPCFNDACYKAWPKVQQFVSEQEPGSLIADVGCGNGKYLHISSQVYKLGCDYGFPSVESARSEGHEVRVCHGLRLPLPRGILIHLICSVLVIHHFSTEERCMRAIKETARILRVGGQIMIYVWAMEQNWRRFEKQDIFVPWNPSPPSCSSGEPCPCGVQKSILHKDKELALNQPCRKLDGTSEKELAVRQRLKIDHHPKQGAFCHPQNKRRPGSSPQRAVNESTPTAQSRQQPWLRYYHAFKEGDLAELIDCHIPELYITQSYFDHANWCVIAEKTEVWKI
ncbi:putative tRNA methyltransferase 9B [Buteo buteo]|uniref:putative tRNA methyltransferase 9B n=1 Tax=Buteo buteo TaxID=30397 RepID=UPI003EBF79C4